MKTTMCYKYFDCGIWLKTVWITECCDNQRPDNQGTTVVASLACLNLVTVSNSAITCVLVTVLLESI